MSIITSWNGHYWRDRAGVWRYTDGLEPVPGARDRLAWDGVHDYPTVDVHGEPYVRIPEGRFAIAMDELRPYVLHHGALVEERERCIVAYLVPAYAWQVPTTAHPEGGMWAPELEAGALVTRKQFAERMGWTLAVFETRHAEGLVPRAVVKRDEGPKYLERGRAYWTVPIVEMWRERYLRAHPPTPRTLKIAATNRAKRAERLSAAALQRESARLRRGRGRKAPRSAARRG